MLKEKENIREKKLFTTGEVAKLLDLHLNTVTNLARSGRLPAVRNPGGGRFYIKRETLAQLLKEREIEVPGVWPETETILLVDDDPRVHRLLRREFARSRVPIEIHSETSVEKAVTKIARGIRVKLVVIDWEFEDTDAMQGRDAVKYLRKAPAARGIKVALFTGKNIYEARKVARRYGIREVIEKPISPEQFKDRIWPLVFGKDHRGEKERRRPMKGMIPR